MPSAPARTLLLPPAAGEADGGPGPGFGRGGPRGWGWRPNGHGGRGFGGHFGFGPRIWDEIDLDAAQKAKLIDVMTNNFRSGLEARMEMRDAMKALRDIRDDDNAASDAIIAANQAVGAARGKLEALSRQHGEDLRQILTPEQQKTLDELRDNRPDRPAGQDGRRWNRGDRGHRPGRGFGPRR